MSGEQKATKASHINAREPFAPADDITLTALHRSVVELQKSNADWFGSFNRRMDVFHEELGLLRQHVLGSQEPRLVTVEKTTRTLGDKAKVAAGWTGIASLGLTIAAQIAAMYRPSMVGPIQAIAQMFGGQ